MYKFIFSTFSIFALLGCSGFSAFSDNASMYEVRMKAGNSFYSKTRPKVDADGYYRFNDVNGQEYVIYQNTVLFIEPAKAKK